LDFSIVELFVYGIIAYFSLIVLIKSATDKAEVATSSQTLIKSVYMLPGIVCMFILAFAAPTIIINDSIVTTNNTAIYEVLDNTNAIVVLNSTVSETGSTINSVELLNTIWGLAHVMFAMIMVIFIITKLLQLLTVR
jgi:hypothetical protein